MNAAVKVALLRAAKLTGMFRLAEVMTASRLRIVCYHGASWSDEHRFRPMLFMSPENFARRMRWLRSRSFPVLRLDAALRLLTDGRLPPRAVVITIDDGWSGTLHHMLPLLRQYDWPSTLYVATRPLRQAGPILHVLVDYLLWRAKAREIDLSAVDPRLSGHYGLASTADRVRAAAAINGALREKADARERQVLLDHLAAALGQDTHLAQHPRLAHLMTLDELTTARDYGVDLQLHTHSHRMPIADAAKVREEIEANRAVLQAVASSNLNHFCYPSGVYDATALPVLAGLGIESATTCEPGLADRQTPRLLLPRFVDADDLPQVVFEAEVSGLLEIARGFRRLVLRRSS